MRKSYDKNDLGKSFGVAVFVMLISQLLLSAIFGAFAKDGVLPNWAFWTMQTLYILLVGLSAVIYAKMTKTDMLTATKMNKPPVWSHVGWGCLSVVFLVTMMLPLNYFFTQLFVKIGLKEPSVDLPLQIVPMIIVVCILPSVTEEIVFRGTVAQSLKNNKNKLASLAIVGALFAVYHLNAAQTLHQFVLGALFALVVFRSGSVWTSALIHLFNNLLAVVLQFTLKSNIFVTHWWIFIPIGLLGFAGSIVGYLFTTKSRWETDEEEVKWTGRSIALFVVAIATCVALWVLGLFNL